MINDTEIDALDTVPGKVILSCLLLKTGKQLKELLENYTLQDFIDERYELYVDTLSSILTSEDYHKGNISASGAEEIARAEAFRGLS